MKGLLLKEWYMIKKYCRVYLLITVVFLAASYVNDDNPFFILYPCLLCGMIPVYLLSYDERSGWIRYSGTLPYTKAQLVSVKYLTGLFSMLVVLAATSIIQTIKMTLDGAPASGPEHLLMIQLVMIILMFFSSSFCLPFVFRFGTEKGRIIYLVMIGMFFGGVAVASGLFKENPVVNIKPDILLLCLFLAGCGLYALSWVLSIAFYKKREM